MYNSIPDHISIDDLTTVVHYSIKILNKYRSRDNRDLEFDKLPLRDLSSETRNICRKLLDEINVEALRENDVELDRHINQLFLILGNKIKLKVGDMKAEGERLLKQFDRGC